MNKKTNDKTPDPRDVLGLGYWIEPNPDTGTATGYALGHHNTCHKWPASKFEVGFYEAAVAAHRALDKATADCQRQSELAEALDQAQDELQAARLENAALQQNLTITQQWLDRLAKASNPPTVNRDLGDEATEESMPADRLPPEQTQLIEDFSDAIGAAITEIEAKITGKPGKPWHQVKAARGLEPLPPQVGRYGTTQAQLRQVQDALDQGLDQVKDALDQVIDQVAQLARSPEREETPLEESKHPR